MSSLVFPLIGYAITHSAALAGLATTAVFAGRIATRLPVGALVDRWPRNRTLIVANLAAGAAYTSLAVAALAGGLSLAHLVVAGVVSGVCDSFIRPAASASIRTVVLAEGLPVAYARLNASDHAVQLVGPPVGGALFSVAHGLPFVVDAASYVLATVCVAFVRTPLVAPDADGTPRTIRRDIADGLRYLWGETAVRAMMIWGGIINLGMALVLVTITLRLVRAGVHPAAIGAIETAAAVAGLLGALVAARIVTRVRTGRLAVLTGAACALTVVPIAFTTDVAVIGTLLAIGTFLLPANNSGISAYVAARVPNRMQGRFNAAAGFIAEGLLPLGPVVAGVLLASTGGLTATLVGAGVVALSLLPIVLSHEVRTLGRPDQWRPAEG
jgi:MFS family permease